MSGNVNVCNGCARVLQNLQDLFDLFFVLRVSYFKLELLNGLLQWIKRLALACCFLFVQVGLGCFELIVAHFKFIIIKLKSFKWILSVDEQKGMKFKNYN